MNHTNESQRTPAQDVLPLYFDMDSIGPELAAEIIDILSELSLRTVGHPLEIVAQEATFRARGG